MPNRILKESICTSDSIDSLSWFEEVLFYRLIVNCDDYGRFDGRVSVIKNRLFPLKENITAQSVKKSIDKLATVGLVALYVFEGKPFLQLPTWEHHQIVRAKKSKYPPVPNDLNTFACNCNQMQTNVSVIQSNPIQSEYKSEYKSEPEHNAPARVDLHAERFARFWSAYPKKVGKGAAEKAFQKIKPSESLLQKMLDAIAIQRTTDQWTKDKGRFIPNPSTWLNQSRWEDEGVDLVLGRCSSDSEGSSNPFFDYYKTLEQDVQAPYEADFSEVTGLIKKKRLLCWQP